MNVVVGLLFETNKLMTRKLHKRFRPTPLHHAPNILLTSSEWRREEENCHLTVRFLSRSWKGICIFLIGREHQSSSHPNHLSAHLDKKRPGELTPIMGDFVEPLDDLSNIGNLVNDAGIDDVMFNRTILQYATSGSVFFTLEDLGELGPLLQQGELSQSDVAEYLREPRPSSEQPCPTGFICNIDEMANCTRVRIVSVLFGFGDVHAGSFCPYGEDRLLNCPVGFYCENAETITSCPSKFFCPHKTLVPEINCYQCDEGETRLQRDL